MILTQWEVRDNDPSSALCCQSFNSLSSVHFTLRPLAKKFTNKFKVSITSRNISYLNKLCLNPNKAYFFVLEYYLCNHGIKLDLSKVLRGIKFRYWEKATNLKVLSNVKRKWEIFSRGNIFIFMHISFHERFLKLQECCVLFLGILNCILR